MGLPEELRIAFAKTEKTHGFDSRSYRDIFNWRWDIYIAKLVTAVPYTATYAVSNVFFLELMLKPVGEKLNRIQTKHGIF